MSARELDDAGIVGTALRGSYEQCRRLNAKHGKTYYLATRLLPARKRPYVHALYGLARYADEIVDDLASDSTVDQRAAVLANWADSFLLDLKRGESDDPIGRAVVDTAITWDIPAAHFESFFQSMAMDLTVVDYASYAGLSKYVYGSAAVIGLEMVPILEPTDPDAYTYACDLGFAFQLANFVRDVDEDLNRGRVYLPLDELAMFGLERSDLERRVVDDRVRGLLSYQIQRVRSLAASASKGTQLLHPTSRPCIDAARVLYCGIVDEVERIDYQVFDKRATVPMRRRLAVASRAWLSATAVRHQRRQRGGPATGAR